MATYEQEILFEQMQKDYYAHTFRDYVAKTGEYYEKYELATGNPPPSETGINRVKTDGAMGWLTGLTIAGTFLDIVIDNSDKISEKIYDKFDEYLGDFDDYLKNYTGDNKTMLNAKEVYEEKSLEGKFRSWYCSALWNAFKTTVNFAREEGGASWTLPGARDWWTITTALGKYIRSRGKIEIPGEGGFDSVDALKQAILQETGYNFDAMATTNMDWGGVTYNAKTETDKLLKALIDSGSDAYFVKFQSENGQYLHSYAYNTRSDLGDLYILYPSPEVSTYYDTTEIYKACYPEAFGGDSRGILGVSKNVSMAFEDFVLHPKDNIFTTGYYLQSPVPYAIQCLHAINNTHNLKDLPGTKDIGSRIRQGKIQGWWGSDRAGYAITGLIQLLSLSGGLITTITPGVINTLTDDAQDQTDGSTTPFTQGSEIGEDGSPDGNVNYTYNNFYNNYYKQTVDGDISPSDLLKIINTSIIDTKTDTSTGGKGEPKPDEDPKTLPEIKKDIDDNTTDPDKREPSIPTVSSASLGLYRIFNPTNSEVKELGNFLWSQNIFDQIKKIWSDPMEGIISLATFPIKPNVSSKKEIYLGYLGTGVRSLVVNNQFKRILAGSVLVPKYHNSYLDYNPFTTIQMYIPYVGIVDVDVEKVMGNTVSLYYTVDFLTGCFAASLFVKEIGDVIANFSGSMSSQIPLSSGSYDGLLRSIASVGVGAATGGAAGAITSGISAVLNKQTTTKVSGAISGCAGTLSGRRPYIIIQRPIPVIPDDYDIHGRPNFKSGIISDFTGFSIFSDVKLDNIDCSDEIKNRIRESLTSGVFV